MNESGQPVMAEHINRLNKILVLNIIRQEREISRAEIVKKSGLSAPTVTRIVESLIHIEKLAVEVGVGESRGGRPPLLVRFNSEGNYVIGIDWGRTHIHGIIANLNAETIFNLDIPISTDSAFDKGIKIIDGLVNTLITSSAIDKSKLLGIGLAVAGFLNTSTQEIEYSPNFGWTKINMQKILQERFEKPIILDNVSRVMAQGELWFGKAKNIKNFIFANIGYGLGAGVIVEGKPFIGYDGFAGEIGHNRVSCLVSKVKPRRCTCGKYDCLECFASGRGIAQSAKEELEKYPDSLIHHHCEGDLNNVTTAMVAMAAKAGDKFARKLLEQAAEILGIALANVANTLNPETVIVGGKVASSGEFFMEKLKKVFYRESLPHVKRRIEIQNSGLLGETAVKGAVALILKEVLDLNVKPNTL